MVGGAVFGQLAPAQLATAHLTAPVTPPVQEVATSLSLTTYRQELAKALRAYVASTATGGTVGTLIDSSWPIRTPNFSKNDVFEGWHLLRPIAALAADKVRQVPPNTAGYTGYAPAAGVFQPDANWTITPSGEPYELHGHGFEPLTQLTEIINAGLKRIPLKVWAPFDPSESSGTVQDLTAQLSWLTREDDVYQVGLLAANGREVQTITQSGSPSGGTFTLTFRGVATGAIAYNAADSVVQTALRALPGLGTVTVARTGSSTNFVWTVTFAGAPLYLPELTASAALLTPSGTLIISTTTKLSPLLMLNGEVWKDSDHVYLNAGAGQSSSYWPAPGQEFLPGDWLYLHCRKSAYDHCRASSAGAFGDRASLAAETHEAEPIAEWVVAAALVEAWYRYPQAMDDAVERRRIQNMQTAWAALQAYERSYFKEPARTLKIIETGVPVSVY